MTTETYTLTAAEAARYDDGDARGQHDLFRDLMQRFGSRTATSGPQTAIYHPEGFIVEVLYCVPRADELATEAAAA